MNYSPIYDLLRSDGSIVVNKSLIFAIGLNEAIIYAELVSRFIYFADREDLTKDGYFFNTVGDLFSGTGLGEKPQRAAINNLRKMGLIDVKIQGVPPKRYFTIKDNQELLCDLLRKGKQKQVQTLGTSKLRHLGGINSANMEETITPNGRTNNTKVNNTTLKILKKEKDNGPNSGEIRTQYVSPHIESAKVAMKYYIEVYRKKKGREHPKLKKSQIDTVLNNICLAIADYDLSEEGLTDMINLHFKRNIDSDYNINHFATEGILANLMYGVAY